MRPPLIIKVFIRSAKGDAAYRGKPGVENKNLLGSPAGGAFGMVRNGGHTAHQGWDIYAPEKTPIVAIADGKIVDAGSHSGYGRCVILRFHSPGHDQALYAPYGHQSVPVRRTHGRERLSDPRPESVILGFASKDNLSL